MKRENQRRSIIRDLNLGKTTSKAGYNAYMKEYMARMRALEKARMRRQREVQQRVATPAQVLFQQSNVRKRRRR